MIKNLKSMLMKSEMESNKRGEKFLDSYLNVEKSLNDGTPIFAKLKIAETIYPESSDFKKVYIVELTEKGLKVYQKKNLSKPEESLDIPFDSTVTAKVRLVRYLVFGTGIPTMVVYTLYDVMTASNKYTFIVNSIACIPELEKFYKANNLQLDIPVEYSKMFDSLTVDDIRNKVIKERENFEELPVGTFLPII